MNMQSYLFNDYLNKKHEIKLNLHHLERLNRNDANYQSYLKQYK